MEVFGLNLCCVAFAVKSFNIILHGFLKVAYWSKGDFHVAFDYKAFEGAI